MPRNARYTLRQAERIAAAFPNEVFRKLQDEATKTADEARRAGSDQFYPKYFPYIQFYHESFILGVVNRLATRGKFVDIGCGAGDKLALLHTLRPKLKLYGIERDPKMVAKARELCPFATIIEGDALEQDYSPYDYLYSYTPICDKLLWGALMHRVMALMDRSAKFFCVDINRLPHFRWLKRKIHTEDGGVLMYSPTLIWDEDRQGV